MLTYHASPHLFEFPDYDLVCANRENHANGNLGLWVSMSPDWISGFGSNIYSLEVSGITKDLPLKTLSQWDKDSPNDPDFYSNMRQSLLNEGVTFLRLVEIDGRSDMGIVIDFKAISSFKRINQLAPAPTPTIRSARNRI